MEKDLVFGLGEIGNPIFKIFSTNFNVGGYDLNPNLMNKIKIEKLKNHKTIFAHICIPYNNNFEKNVIDIVNTHNPKGVIIHSTISPHTTERLQHKLKIPVIYSATRGVHKRMAKDMKRYVKFYSVYDWAPQSEWARKSYANRLKKSGIKSQKMSNPLVLELAKIVTDTSYYGWLITYAQLSNMIAIENKVDYDEMWSFADEIHKYLGNRPKMFPGFIGGHCVIPNLDLIRNPTLDMIKEINDIYSNKVKNSKEIAKKYESK